MGMIEYKVGQIVTIEGHQWLIDNVLLNCPSRGQMLQVRSQSKLRFTVRTPEGATGWQTSFWVK